MIENKEYFEKHKYRNPADYLVKAFIAPKIKFIEEQGCFKRNNIKIPDVGSGNVAFSHYLNKYAGQGREGRLGFLHEEYDYPGECPRIYGADIEF